MKQEAHRMQSVGRKSALPGNLVTVFTDGFWVAREWPAVHWWRTGRLPLAHASQDEFLSVHHVTSRRVKDKRETASYCVCSDFDWDDLFVCWV